MSVYIEKIEIAKLFGKKNIKWNLKDTNVLVGKNGSGKSTILKTIYSLLKQNIHNSTFPGQEFTITLGNKEKAYIKSACMDLEPSLLSKVIDIVTSKKSKKGSKKNETNERLTDLIDYINTNYSNSFKLNAASIGTINVDHDSDYLKSLNIEFISTAIMSANSINEIKKTDGVKSTIINLEMVSELDQLKKNKDESRLKNFIKVINSFFADTDKSAQYQNEEMNFIDLKTNEKITIDKLSSGETQLLFILIKVFNTSNENTLLLMDEPEISLHLKWQEQLISSIRELNNKCQLIIVTHSPAIIMGGHLDSYVDIDDISELIHD